jgi:hypothetical protein
MRPSARSLWSGSHKGASPAARRGQTWRRQGAGSDAGAPDRCRTPRRAARLCRAAIRRRIHICPAFKVLRTTGKIMNDDMLFYRASTRDCSACATSSASNAGPVAALGTTDALVFDLHDEMACPLCPRAELLLLGSSPRRAACQASPSTSRLPVPDTNFVLLSGQRGGGQRRPWSAGDFDSVGGPAFEPATARSAAAGSGQSALG